MGEGTPPRLPPGMVGLRRGPLGGERNALWTDDEHALVDRLDADRPGVISMTRSDLCTAQFIFDVHERFDGFLCTRSSHGLAKVRTRSPIRGLSKLTFWGPEDGHVPTREKWQEVQRSGLKADMLFTRATLEVHLLFVVSPGGRRAHKPTAGFVRARRVEGYDSADASAIWSLFEVAPTGDFPTKGLSRAQRAVLAMRRRVPHGPSPYDMHSWAMQELYATGPSSEMCKGPPDGFDMRLTAGSLSAARGAIAKTRPLAMRVLMPTTVLGVKG